jgi:hypothetical protein
MIDGVGDAMAIGELATSYGLATCSLTVARLMTAAKSATRTHAARIADRHHRKYVSFRECGFRRIIAQHAGAQLGEVS